MPEQNVTEAPKAFISYSWSTPNHEARVLDLATDLRASGVNVILDKWDLREGQESTAFMEQMVTDVSVQKVIIVFDRIYAEKSNARKGGAGTEAQIISPQLYKKKDEGKFVALVFEKDDRGEAYVPAYYTSRIFIDFTDASRQTESFEQLLRWIFDKPLHKKPAIGRRPVYLEEGAATISLETSVAHRRAMHALQNNLAHSFAATQEYLEALTSQLQKFRIYGDADPLSDDIIENYHSFLPYRNEVIELIRTIALYTTDPRYGSAIHTFLERFLVHFHATPESGRYRDFDFDNYKFFAHELFIYICTIFVETTRPDFFEIMVSKPYYDRVRGEMGGVALSDYGVFSHFDRLLDFRKKQLGSRRISLQADLMKERSAGSGFRFEQVMQIDFLLFLRHTMLHGQGCYSWYPSTLQLMGFRHRAFEIFERAQSAKEFSKVLGLLGLDSRQRLDQVMAEYASGERRPLSFDGSWGHLDIAQLAGHDHLATRP